MKSGRAALCILFIVISIISTCAMGSEVTKVKKGDLRITLKPEGEFVPGDPVEVKLWPEAYENPLRIEEIVKNGKMIKKGDVLLRFEKEPLEHLIQIKELDLKTANLKLADVRTAITMLDLEMELAIAVAENKLMWAKKDQAGYIQTELALDEEQRQYNRQGSVDGIQDQKEEIEQLGKMYSEDELTEETEEIVLRRAKRRLDRSIKRLDLSDRRQDYSVGKEKQRKLSDMQLAVRSSEQELSKLQATQKNQKELKEIELQKTEIETKKQATELERLHRDLEKFVIYASRAGIVIHGGEDAEEQKILKIKDSCKPYTTLLTIATPGEVKAKCMIDEKDIFRIRPNMPVTVTPVALHDTKLSGSLEPLDQLPGKENQWKAIVKLNESDPRLVPGMKCKMDILLEEIKDVLIVPAKAVLDKDGKKICYVKKDDGHEVREVVVGKADESNVEIRSGLEEGQEIFLTEPGKDKDQEEQQK